MNEIDNICEKGDLQSLILLISKGEKLSLWSLPIAAGYGHLHIIEYAHKHLCSELSYFINLYAASNGHLHILQYTTQNNFPLHPSVLQHAASNDQLHIIKFGLKNNFPYDLKLFEEAASKGNLSILRYSYFYNKKHKKIQINNQVLYSFFKTAVGDGWSQKQISHDALQCLIFMLQHNFPICKRGIDLLSLYDSIFEEIVNIDEEWWISLLDDLQEKNLLTSHLAFKYNLYKVRCIKLTESILNSYISKDVVKHIINKY